VARLGPGEFFGEVELMNGSKSIASIRVAPEGPAELVMLRRDEFHELLSKSPLTEQSIGQIVQARIEENRAHDRRNR
jgi:CRP-like cAMP-binding protein